jgi:hypothetical protein
MMEGVRNSETSVYSDGVISEGSHLQTRRCENIKSQIAKKIFCEAKDLVYNYSAGFFVLVFVDCLSQVGYGELNL